MEAKKKIIYSELLLFSFIGFLIYLSVIIGGFIASEMGVTSAGFNSIFWGEAIIGFLSFAVCSYLTCFKKKKR